MLNGALSYSFLSIAATSVLPWRQNFYSVLYIVFILYFVVCCFALFCCLLFCFVLLFCFEELYYICQVKVKNN